MPGGGGNTSSSAIYDYGARMYDSRLGRFLSIDPLQVKFPSQSPYSYAANSPVAMLDKDGKYAYWMHFKITYLALTGAGIDKVTAAKVAHYASVYADHPDPRVSVGVPGGYTVNIYDHNTKPYKDNAFIGPKPPPETASFKAQKEREKKGVTPADNTKVKSNKPK